MPCETFAESSDDKLHSATEPFVLLDEMTESSGLVRLLTSRSRHVALSRLELSEVTKGTIVPFDLSAFFAIEGLPLPHAARMQKKNKEHFIICQNRVVTTLFNRPGVAVAVLQSASSFINSLSQ